MSSAKGFTCDQPTVPHAAWTTDSSCLQIDVFCPPRKTLLALAAEQQAAGSQGRG